MSQFSASSVAVQKLRLGSVAPKESDLHGAAQALIRLQVASSWTFVPIFILFGTWTCDSRSISLSGCIRAWYRLIGRGKDRQASNKSKVRYYAHYPIYIDINHMTIAFWFSCIIPQVECSRLPLHGQALLQRGSAQVILVILSVLCFVVSILVSF